MNAEIRSALLLALLIASLAIVAPSASPATPTQLPRPGALRVVGPTESRPELILELGPFDLPAHAAHDDAPQPPPSAVRLQVAGWMHGYAVEIVDAKGGRLPQQLLHHVNVIAPGRRELFSPIMQRLAAAGAETAPVRLPRLIGYPVREGDVLIVTAMLHNPSGTAYTGARLRVRFPFTRASSAIPRLAIQPFYVDVMPPAGSHSFDLPPGRSERSWEGRPAVSGRILGVSGHLHRYGLALRFEDVTARRVIWEAKPTTNARGDVVSMPRKRFLATLGVPVRHDHLYRLTAVYHNPTGGTVVDGGMGALGGMMLPSRRAAWPSPDTTDPEYERDVRLTWRVDGRHVTGRHH